jgi:hypothetical protein
MTGMLKCYKLSWLINMGMLGFGHGMFPECPKYGVELIELATHIGMSINSEE